MLRVPRGGRAAQGRQTGPREDSGRIPETRSAREVEEAEREKLFSRAESRIHMQHTKDQQPPPRPPSTGSRGSWDVAEPGFGVCGPHAPT